MDDFSEEMPTLECNVNKCNMNCAKFRCEGEVDWEADTEPVLAPHLKGYDDDYVVQEDEE